MGERERERESESERASDQVSESWGVCVHACV